MIHKTYVDICHRLTSSSLQFFGWSDRFRYIKDLNFFEDLNIKVLKSLEEIYQNIFITKGLAGFLVCDKDHKLWIKHRKHYNISILFIKKTEIEKKLNFKQSEDIDCYMSKTEKKIIYQLRKNKYLNFKWPKFIE